MANLPESASFDAGIYQIETTDAVIGGVNGISNLQAKALANRTTWLKQQVDALNALKGKGIAAHSTGSSYAGGDQVIYQKNIWQANTAITPREFNPANWTRQLGNAAEVDISTTSPAALGSAAVGASTTLARSDHVHAMPTLDALANTLITSNANGEILRWNGTNWINNTLAEAGIAPVASPTFTGVPAGPTAAAGTNTTQLATTAFVDALGALKANLASPALTGTPTAPNPSTGLRSQALATMQKFADEFGSSIATSGWQKLPSGLIIQWGRASSTTAGIISVALPVTFPSSKFFEVALPIVGSALGWDTAQSTGNTSLSQVEFNRRGGNGVTTNELTTFDIYWLAIGR